MRVCGHRHVRYMVHSKSLRVTDYIAAMCVATYGRRLAAARLLLAEPPALSFCRAAVQHIAGVQHITGVRHLARVHVQEAQGPWAQEKHSHFEEQEYST